ncbi:MAG: hypothetical protein IPL59_00560 [Candidatus Competibacteraceae bacterium]|nr:hypothetical protein [Candidatus Competibacteraceae bacterium]
MDALASRISDPLSRGVALPCDDAGVGHYRVSGPIGELTRQRTHPQPAAARWAKPTPLHA